MHIPDNFLDTKTWATAAVVSTAAIGGAVRSIRHKSEEEMARAIPMMGAMGAFVFAAMMINFPVPGGTSGHLVGAALLAITLGLAPSIVVLSVVVILQALLFQDGGLVVMGANVFNMAVIAPLAGAGVYYTLRRVFPRHGSWAELASAWFSVMAAAAAAAVELAVSGTVPWIVVLPAMLGWHALIGVGEAAITLSALRLINRAGILPQANGTAPTGAGKRVEALAMVPAGLPADREEVDRIA